ncbi:hypothetical protein A3F56_02695 [Candidatus Kaiserbacteria bacterium RIFCSPHIGHO2_12_FULL_55_13]|nr:MAG: hypothetical protein A3F56_02695 [Candidatus Kaiserbacteria bacterium RIFCSPHIGHO2_12_FULL_55_13]
MTVRVIVTQSAIGSAFEKARELTATGLRQGEDFVTASHPEDVEWAFAKNERQLLIVGTWHGAEEPTVDFVKKAKEKNPNLVVWFYSSMPWPSKYPEAYDRVITGPNRPGIPELVRSYLSASGR